jgi:hypothetical protein
MSLGISWSDPGGYPYSHQIYTSFLKRKEITMAKKKKKNKDKGKKKGKGKK